MKKHILGFIRRGILSAWGGPIVMAIIYFFLGQSGEVPVVSTKEAGVAIVSAALLAFIAGGLTELYSVEKLPVIVAAFIHGVALYLDYLIIYLINGWLRGGALGILIFSGVFILGYCVVWLFIYRAVKRDTEKLNTKLKNE